MTGSTRSLDPNLRVRVFDCSLQSQPNFSRFIPTSSSIGIEKPNRQRDSANLVGKRQLTFYKKLLELNGHPSEFNLNSRCVPIFDLRSREASTRVNNKSNKAKNAPNIDMLRLNPKEIQKNRSRFFIKCECNRINVLANHFTIDPIWRRDCENYEDFSDLHIAVFKEDEKAIKEMLDPKSETISFELLQKKDANNLTALHWAVIFGNKKIIKTILDNLKPEDKIAALNMEDDRGWSILKWAFEKYDLRDEDLIETIFYSLKDVDESFFKWGCNLYKNPDLQLKIEQLDRVVLQILLTYGLSEKDKIYLAFNDFILRSLFSIIINSSDEENFDLLFDKLLPIAKFPLNEFAKRSEFINTLFNFIILMFKKNQLFDIPDEILKNIKKSLLLVFKETPISERKNLFKTQLLDQYNNNLIVYLVRYGQEDILIELFKLLEPKDIFNILKEPLDEEGNSPFRLLLENSKKDGIIEILKLIENFEDFSELHIAVFNEDEKAIKEILDPKSEKNSFELIQKKDANNLTALHWAVIFGNKKIIKTILDNLKPEEKVAALNMEDDRGKSVLKWAFAKDDLGLIEIIFSSLIDVDKSILEYGCGLYKNPVLQVRIKRLEVAALQILLQRGISEKDKIFLACNDFILKSLFFIIINYADEEIFEFLIDKLFLNKFTKRSEYIKTLFNSIIMVIEENQFYDIPIETIQNINKSLLLAFKETPIGERKNLFKTELIRYLIRYELEDNLIELLKLLDPKDRSNILQEPLDEVGNSLFHVLLENDKIDYFIKLLKLIENVNDRKVFLTLKNNFNFTILESIMQDYKALKKILPDFLNLFSEDKGYHKVLEEEFSKFIKREEELSDASDSSDDLSDISDSSNDLSSSMDY